MFTKTLLPNTMGAIKLISGNKIIQNAYLAGGTALALQLGHRISVDLDFFTKIDFDEKILSRDLTVIKNFKQDGLARKTVWGNIGKIKFSYFYYKYPLLKKTILFEGIQLASLEDIAAMKINAVEDRGTKRDFIDLYFLAQKFNLEKMLEFYNEKYKTLDDHLYSILRSLDYFADAEADERPLEMLIPVSWEEVKKFFKSESMRLAKTLLHT